MCQACAAQVPAADLKAFASKDDAWEAMDSVLDQTDEQCRDNYRFAFVDEPEAVAAYERAIENGCCGSYDSEVLVAGRRAWIGCNYGH